MTGSVPMPQASHFPLKYHRSPMIGPASVDQAVPSTLPIHICDPNTCPLSYYHSIRIVPYICLMAPMMLSVRIQSKVVVQFLSQLALVGLFSLVHCSIDLCYHCWHTQQTTNPKHRDLKWLNLHKIPLSTVGRPIKKHPLSTCQYNRRSVLHFKTFFKQI